MDFLLWLKHLKIAVKLSVFSICVKSRDLPLNYENVLSFVYFPRNFVLLFFDICICFGVQTNIKNLLLSTNGISI